VTDVIVRARLLKWGNSMGLRISKHDARRLRLQVGAELVVRIASEPAEVDLSVLRTFRGGGDAAADHDRILGEARARELRR
jgi:hypothetical protein